MTAPAHVLAIDVGGTVIKAGVLDRAGHVVRSCERNTVGGGPRAAADAIVAVAAELVCSAPNLNIVAAGVVVPGVVDADAGIARYSANLGWRDLPLRQLLSDAVQLPIAIANDVRAATLAEHRDGQLAGVADGVLVVIGTGIAAGIVSGGRLLTGASGLAGELGHLSVYPGGRECGCGQLGCLEVYASARAIERRYVQAIAADRRRVALSARELVAVLDTDERAAAVWREATDALAVGLTDLTMLLDPSVVVLAGGLSQAGERLRAPLQAALADRLRWRPAPRLISARRGAYAGRAGAAHIAWQLVDGGGQ